MSKKRNKAQQQEYMRQQALLAEYPMNPALSTIAEKIQGLVRYQNPSPDVYVGWVPAVVLVEINTRSGRANVKMHRTAIPQPEDLEIRTPGVVGPDPDVTFKPGSEGRKSGS